MSSPIGEHSPSIGSSGATPIKGAGKDQIQSQGNNKVLKGSIEVEGKTYNLTMTVSNRVSDTRLKALMAGNRDSSQKIIQEFLKCKVDLKSFSDGKVEVIDQGKVKSLDSLPRVKFQVASQLNQLGLRGLAFEQGAPPPAGGKSAEPTERETVAEPPPPLPRDPEPPLASTPPPAAKDPEPKAAPKSKFPSTAPPPLPTTRAAEPPPLAPRDPKPKTAPKSKFPSTAPPSPPTTHAAEPPPPLPRDTEPTREPVRAEKTRVEPEGEKTIQASQVPANTEVPTPPPPPAPPVTSTSGGASSSSSSRPTADMLRGVKLSKGARRDDTKGPPSDGSPSAADLIQARRGAIAGNFSSGDLSGLTFPSGDSDEGAIEKFGESFQQWVKEHEDEIEKGVYGEINALVSWADDAAGGFPELLSEREDAGELLAQFTSLTAPRSTPQPTGPAAEAALPAAEAPPPPPPSSAPSAPSPPPSPATPKRSTATSDLLGAIQKGTKLRKAKSPPTSRFKSEPKEGDIGDALGEAIKGVSLPDAENEVESGDEEWDADDWE